MGKTLSILTLAIVLMFTVSAIAHDKVVVVPLGGNKATGDAVAEDVLEGKTFSNKDEVGVTGSMPNNGAVTFNPGATDQTVPEGYHNGSGTVKGDANLTSGNIKSGATIFGVTGTSIESTGTATPDQVLTGQTFSSFSGPATGTMPDSTQDIIPGNTAKTIPAGYHDGSGSVATDANLTSDNIKSGVSIFGVTGLSIQASGAATDAQVLSGITYSNASGLSTGNMPNIGQQVITPTTTAKAINLGYHDGNGYCSGDANLVTGNIRSGVSIFGVPGDVNIVNTSTGDAVAGEILNGKKAWVDGSMVTGTIPSGSDISGANGLKTFTITDGYYSGSKTATANDTNLAAGNIKSGVTVFGQAGTFTEEATSPMAATDLRSGKIGFVNGAKVTGTMSTQTMSDASTTLSAGYYDATNLATVDPDLTANNIIVGKNIYGIDGTFKVDWSCSFSVYPQNSCVAVANGKTCSFDDEAWFSSRCSLLSELPACPPDPDPTPLVNNNYKTILQNDCDSQGFDYNAWKFWAYSPSTPTRPPSYYEFGASCIAYYRDYYEYMSFQNPYNKCAYNGDVCNFKYPHIQCY